MQIFASWFWGIFRGTVHGMEVVNGASSCQSPSWTYRALQKSKALGHNALAMPIINVALN